MERMNLDEVEKSAGIIEEEGIVFPEGRQSYDNLVDLLQCEVFDFCCCGNPRSFLEFVRDALRYIDERSENSQDMEYKEWVEWSEAKEKRLIGSDGALWFVLYWLDREDFTEHGSSIPG